MDMIGGGRGMPLSIIGGTLGRWIHDYQNDEYSLFCSMDNDIYINQIFYFQTCPYSF